MAVINFDNPVRPVTGTEAIGMALSSLSVQSLSDLRLVNSRAFCVPYYAPLLRIPEEVVRAAIDRTQPCTDFTSWRVAVAEQIGIIGRMEGIPCLVLRPPEHLMPAIGELPSEVLAKSLVVITVNPSDHFGGKVERRLLDAMTAATSSGSDEPLMGLFSNAKFNLALVLQQSPYMVRTDLGHPPDSVPSNVACVMPTALLNSQVRAQATRIDPDRAAKYSFGPAAYAAAVECVMEPVAGNEALSFVLFPGRDLRRVPGITYHRGPPGREVIGKIREASGTVPPRAAVPEFYRRDGKLDVRPPVEFETMQF